MKPLPLLAPVRSLQRNSPRPLSLPALPTIANEKERILDFDIEARPLSWYGGDFTSREVTAIACQFVGESTAYCWMLGEVELPEMLEAFREKYDEATLVTGHYIRAYDLPNLNFALVEQGLPILAPKRTQDTKLDLINWQGYSKSQENIAAMLGIPAPKVGMNQADWREANRLTEKGLALTRQRVIGDVQQHMAMRAELLRRKLLKPPKVWPGKGR